MSIFRPLQVLVAATCLAVAAAAHAAPDAALLAQAERNTPVLLDTLKDLVSIESGSGDREGLDRISQYIAGRLQALGAKVRFIEPGADTYRMHDSPARIGRMVHATFSGSGTRKILLIAHMDTVYLRGMLARQPFRTDGNRAYGLAIADDKAGIAVILHTLAILKEINFRDYGELTVLINGDEEISSPASRGLLARLGAQHDLTMSHEGAASGGLRLATSGVGAVILKVSGRASHAGASPESGRNAIYELAHQMMQTRGLSDPAKGIKMNWTMVGGGTNRNVIPDEAHAQADVRTANGSDFDVIEHGLRETMKKQLIPDTRVDMVLERRRPPFVGSAGGMAVAAHAAKIYGEIGKTMGISTTATGGGTDASFAAAANGNAVVEGFGLSGAGAHSSDAEYVLIDSIAPRLYLATRLIIDFSRGAVALKQ
jgi:glutamate carboxypeptidase